MSHIIIDSYFDDLEHKIKNELRYAKERIWICVAWINIPSYQEILLRKQDEGVEILILCNDDFKNTRNHNKISTLLHNKIYYVRNPINFTLMHHKFCIIDDSVLINGSFNWSKTAYYHYENIMVTRNDFSNIMKFKHEFCDLLYMAQQQKYGAHLTPVSKTTTRFNLGMISEPHGHYENVTLQKWEVDLSNYQCYRLGSVDAHHFYNSISTGLHEDYDDSYIKTKYDYNDDFERIRHQMDTVQNYFDQRYDKVNAIGRAIKYQNSKYEDEESEIEILWIDIRFRKVVPRILDLSGDLERVFDEAWFAGT